MKQKAAFTLLELLLVLICVAAIASWSIHHYQQKVRRAQTLQILSDVKSLQRALDSYFHNVGCKPDSGQFVQNLIVDCEAKLKTKYPVVCERLPLVVNYITKVIDTGKMTQDKNNPKHIYQLEVQAVMDSNLTADQMKWYGQILNATEETSETQTLSWISFPANSYVQLGDNNWILAGASNVFRATENSRTFNAANTASSGSLCAN